MRNHRRRRRESRFGRGRPGGRVRGAACLVLAALAPLVAVVPAGAQQASGLCRMEAVGDGLQAIHCPDVDLTAEAGAALSLRDTDGDGRAEAATLSSGALRIEGSAFTVETPLAIAAVRGTQWAVDVAPGRSAVFVLSGRVAVARWSDGAAVELTDGEGVDVDGGTQPLTVRRWPAERVGALLRRLGR